MRVRRAATYLVDPATGEERLVGNSEGAADVAAPLDDRPAGEIPAAVSGGANASAPAGADADPVPVASHAPEEDEA